MASTEPCTSPLTSSVKSLRPVSFSDCIICSSVRGVPAEPMRVAALAHAVVGDLAGAALVLDDGELVAGFGS